MLLVADRKKRKIPKFASSLFFERFVGPFPSLRHNAREKKDRVRKDYKNRSSAFTRSQDFVGTGATATAAVTIFYLLNQDLK
mmetsp:Transcript_5510/g.12620  ORF Transcript_5510/g.12620 Transcript_5510/m.12620 type:complete len:82 (-) Transcript_5510:29-274(-)